MSLRKREMDEQIWRRRLEREIKARKQAETIMEEKSLELYNANERLKKLNIQLKQSLMSNINALHASESENFALFENAAVGIAICLGDRMLKINQRLSDMLGYVERELSGKSIYETVYLNDREALEENTEALYNYEVSQISHEARLKKSNNMTFWAHFNVSRIKGGKGMNYYIYIIEDVQEKKNYEVKQMALIEQLKEINGQLESFAHVVSHDLKAPLNGMNTVMMWIKQYMEKKGVDDQMKEYLLLVDDRVAKMYRLIEGVMEYSKVSQSDEKRELVNMGEALTETLQLLNVPNHMEIRSKGEFPEIWVNKLKMKQIFLNLIDNALRHNDKKRGLIEISAKENDSFWNFTVRDNGSGVPKRHLNKIFKIFNTLDTTGKHTGIGLALVKKVVEHYNGNITVDSVEGEYCKFTFTLNKDNVKKP